MEKPNKNSKFNFFKYPKIKGTENYNPKKCKLHKKTIWIVQEKIHGANFCFITDGETIEYQKRTSIITLKDDFFGFQEKAQSLHNQIL